MATTKTKQVSPEQLAIEQNEAAKAALITADEKVQTLSLAVDEADFGMDSITDGWHAGDDSASAADYSLAQIEFKRATALYEASQRSAQAIEKSIINVSTELAEIVAPYVKATHPHIEVRTSFLAPPKGMPDPHKLIATVVQSEKISSTGSGVVSGAVSIVFVRQPEHRELDARKIEAAALKDGVSFSISSQSKTEDGYEVDTLRCQANNSHAALPVLRNPTPADAGKFAQSLARTLCGMTRSTTDPNIRMLSGEHAGFASEVASVIPIAYQLGEVKVDTEGHRFTTVTATLRWITEGVRKPQTPVETRLRQLLVEEVGIFHPNLGTVTEATARTGDADPLHRTESVVTVVFYSQKLYEYDNPIWPHSDALIWPHPAAVRVVLALAVVAGAVGQVVAAPLRVCRVVRSRYDAVPVWMM